MIELKTLAERFEDLLNDGLTGNIEYKLFVDTGKLKKAYRQRNTVKTVVNGIYTSVSSDISNVYESADKSAAGLVIATMTNEITLVVPCQDEEEDTYSVMHNPDGTTKQALIEVGNYNFIQTIRARLDDIAARVDNFTEDKYDVSSSFTIADTGIREQLPELGDCITFSVQAFYNIVENGDNSREWTIKLDGQILPYSNITFDRQTTSETTVYANRGLSTSSIVVADTFSVGIEIPSVLIGFNDTIKDFVINGSKNDAHVAEITYGKDTKGNANTAFKLVLLSNGSDTASGVLNVGQKIQLNETKEEYGIISFSNKYKIFRRRDGLAGNFEIKNASYALVYDPYSCEYSFHKAVNGIVTIPVILVGRLLIVASAANTSSLSTNAFQQIQ